MGKTFKIGSLGATWALVALNASIHSLKNKVMNIGGGVCFW